MQTVTVACHAMATRFEVVLHGENPVALRAAGEEALAEVDRLESQLSLYRSTSEIAHLNSRAANEPVRVSPELFALLQQAQRLHAETSGAFDITIAPLVRCWGFMGCSGHLPYPKELTNAREMVGMGLLQLNAGDSTVRFAREGVMLDLGAIGKGYAIERAADLLREAGITSALLHGGTSTVYGLGHPPDAEAWTVAIHNPRHRQSEEAGPQAAVPPHLGTVRLKDEAMSVSAPRGKSFEVDGKVFGHILDPRTGWPTTGTSLTAVVLPSATETDALSTALLTLGAAGHPQIARLRENIRTLIISECDGRFSVETTGIHIGTP
jgi:thiamine biosynthesis lipoprotein